MCDINDRLSQERCAYGSITAHSYDALANRTSSTITDGRSSDYEYNNRCWLTTETITDAANGNYSASYTYDNVGNRVQGIEAGVTTQYQYDANDRISQQGGVNYTYDANGNTLEENDQGSITRYRWNSRNEMVQHDAGSFVTNYLYNAEGIRHGQSDGVTNRNYLVDANRSYAQVLAESVNGSLDVAYHYGDDLISQTRNDQTHHFHVDGLGSTRVLTDASGNRTDSYGYAGFGEVLAQDGVTDNDYLYTGEQFDEGLDRYYLRARYYDQGVGRFTSMDDWRGEARDPVTLNKYLYGNADPQYFVDPSGDISVSFSLGSLIRIPLYASTAIGISTFIQPRSSIGVGNWTPDLDGRITAHEASYWHRNGDGVEQSVPLNSIDFQGVQSIPNVIDREFVVSLFGKDWSNYSDSAVYGQLALKLVAPNTVSYSSGADFDFEHRPGDGLFRNGFTAYARFSLGKGNPFAIDLTGTARIY